MTTYTGRDSRTPRVTIREAATRLGVTEGAIRKRIQRGSLPKEHGEDGRVYVYLDMYEDKSHPESQADHDPLVEELRDRVRFMERQLDAERDAHREARRIIAGLVQRIPELEIPREEPAQEPPHARSEASEKGSTTGAGLDVTDETRGSERSWWMRWVGR
jgi:hypothetical protein